MRLTDRYVAGKVCRYYFTILLISVSLLLLENLPRIFAAASHLADPLTASGLILLGLLPEYLALAGIFGIYLTSANLAYRLIRRNELSGWTSAGISTFRVTRALAALAIINAAMVMAMLGWLQPAGARMIVRVDRDIALGLYGVTFESKRPTQLGKYGTIFFDDVDLESGSLRGVLVTLPTEVISSQEAVITTAKENSVQISFRQGLIIHEELSKSLRTAHFDNLKLVIPADPNSFMIDDTEPFQKLSDIPTLIATSSSDASAPAFRQTARAEAIYRLTLPFLALLLSWLGFNLGVPDRTASSMAGVGLGLCLVVIALRVANMGRDIFASQALAWETCLLLFMAALCWTIARLNQRFGCGFIDHAVMRAARKFIAVTDSVSTRRRRPRES